MSFRGRKWIWPDQESDQVVELAKKMQLPPALARLLINRGIGDSGQARAFLCPLTEHFHSPWLMLGMDQAVARLTEALEGKEKIIVYGDYDADGIAASVIMVETLQQLGGDIDFFLPSRFDEGYGLHKEPLKNFKENGASLVVTVDCGINAVEEVIYAKELGLGMIITDHHQPLNPVKEAVAVINPLQEKCQYPFKELSGAGIAFKLAAALAEKKEAPFPHHLLDLAALGTTADIVPLLGENRILVSAGLEVMRSLNRTGFKALAAAVSLDCERINSTALAYIFAPAINAAGRMGEALPAAKLLLEKDAEKAGELAGHLQQANQLRRTTEQRILKEAEEAAGEMLKAGEHAVITLAKENWHHGVIGIVASRLTERFNRPVALIAMENGQGRGSARSIPGFDITAALAGCSALLERFGGHEQAAGFTVKTENIDEMRVTLNRYAEANLDHRQLKPGLVIEAELNENEFTFDLASDLERLEPFGTENPVPLLGSRSWEVQSWRLVGADKKHLKLNLRKGETTLTPIIFSGEDFETELEKGRPVDIVFKLKNGYFRNQKTLDVEVKDLRYSDILCSGSLKLDDRRNSEDRLSQLMNILKRKSAGTVVFVSTAARVKMISERCPAEAKCCFVTAGVIKGRQKLPEEFDRLILYDLPLDEELLKLILTAIKAKSIPAVYLLYSSEDIKRNSLLLDHSLPSAEQLKAIISDPKSLAIEPVPSFWERVQKISDEAGLESNGSTLLESSPTYTATRELRESCESFQKFLLEGTAEEICAYLHVLNDSLSSAVEFKANF